MIKPELYYTRKWNMYKWIGSILILASCAGIGFNKSREMQKHLEELEELKKLCLLLRSELQYTRAPFAEVFDKIGKRTLEPFRTWLLELSGRLKSKGTGTFWEIWCDGVATNLQSSRLKPEELEELKGLGKNLEYIESLEVYIEQLEYTIRNTREDYQSKKKLCRSMGIMGGIFLVTLLL